MFSVAAIVILHCYQSHLGLITKNQSKSINPLQFWICIKMRARHFGGNFKMLIWCKSLCGYFNGFSSVVLCVSIKKVDMFMTSKLEIDWADRGLKFGTQVARAVDFKIQSFFKSESNDSICLKSIDFGLEILESKPSDSIFLKSHDKIIWFWFENFRIKIKWFDFSKITRQKHLILRLKIFYFEDKSSPQTDFFIFDFDLEILESKSNDSIFLKSHDKIIWFWFENFRIKIKWFDFSKITRQKHLILRLKIFYFEDKSWPQTDFFFIWFCSILKIDYDDLDSQKIKD